MTALRIFVLLQPFYLRAFDHIISSYLKLFSKYLARFRCARDHSTSMMFNTVTRRHGRLCRRAPDYDSTSLADIFLDAAMPILESQPKQNPATKADRDATLLRQRQLIHRFVAEALAGTASAAPADSAEPGPVLLLTGSMGSGKTSETLKAIVLNSRAHSVWFLTPTLAKAEEACADYETLRAEIGNHEAPAGFVVRGRLANDPLNADHQMCHRPAVAEAVAAAGLPVRRTICSADTITCPLSAVCGSERQFASLRGVESGVFFMSHGMLYGSTAPRPDLLILDEDVTIGSARSSSVPLDDLLVPSSHPRAPQSAWFADCLDAIVHALRRAPGQELAALRASGIDRVVLSRLHTIVGAMLDNDEPPFSPGHDDEIIVYHLERSNRLALRNAKQILDCMEREIDCHRPRLNGVIVHRHVDRPKDGVPVRRDRLALSWLATPLVPTSTPVLMLDGTGDVRLVRQVFSGRPIEHAHLPVERDAFVTQVQNKSFSKQSLTGTGMDGSPVSDSSIAEAATLRRDILRLASEADGPTLVVSTKAVASMFGEALPPGVSVGHFGALRGRNDWQDCRTVIGVGREQPPPAVIEPIARAFAATDTDPFLTVDQYVLQSRPRRLYDGTQVWAPVAVHPDVWGLAVLQQVREANTLQAIDRVRAIFQHRKIVVLSSLVLDITIDRLIDWRQLKAGGTPLEHVMTRFGLLPLAGADLVRLAPDLFRTPEAARQTVARWQKCDGRHKSLTSFANGHTSPLVKISYRHRHNARWSKALVDPRRHPDPARGVGLILETLEAHADPHVHEQLSISETQDELVRTLISSGDKIAVGSRAAAHNN